jgi:hypothetical protein
VLAPLEALPLGLAQPGLGLNQGIDGFNAAVLRSQPDQAPNEIAQMRRRFVARPHRGSGVRNLLRRAGCGQFFGDVVEVDLEVMGQEVDRRALTSRKFDGDPNYPPSKASS